MTTYNRIILTAGIIALVVGICGINNTHWHPFAICLGAGVGLILGTIWILWRFE